MSKMRYILLVALAALLSVACERRPMEEQYLKVYLDLSINRDVINYEVKDDQPGLMRVAFFDAFSGEYISHDFVSQDGGYIFAPHGDVDMVVYNIEAGETRVRNYYVWRDIEAYTNEISEQQRSRFTRYLQSRVDTRPSYDDIRVTPGHLFVAREQMIHIPEHIDGDVFIIKTTARTVVESWTVEVNGITGMEWVGSVSMMLSGQVASNFIALNKRSTVPVAIYFDVVGTQSRNGTLKTGFETFGREKKSGDPAILSILFTDVNGHPYMYNFDVSDQMEINPQQHIIINGEINIPKPEIGGGFKPEVDDWKEHIYDVDI